MELFHFRPMHLGSEMMLGMIAVIKEEPVIDPAVTTHAPGDRLIGIAAVMTKITVQVTEAVTKIKEGQEIKDDVTPVEAKHDKERARDSSQLDVSPAYLRFAALAQLAFDRRRIVAKETQKDIAPRVLRLVLVPMPINREPVDRLTIFIFPVAVAFMMLSVNNVVVSLRKTSGD